MSDVPFTAFGFEVVLDLDDPIDGLTTPLCDAAFAECDGLEMTMQPKTINSAGFNDRQFQLIGPVRYSQVTLKRGMTSNLQLWTWMSLASQGTPAPATGTITMWDSDGTPVVEFQLDKCLPVRMRAPSLNARDGQVAIEELGLVFEKMTVLPAGASGLGGGIGISAGISAGVSASASAGISAGASAGFSAGASAGFSAGASASFSAGASAGASVGGGD